MKQNINENERMNKYRYKVNKIGRNKMEIK